MGKLSLCFIRVKKKEIDINSVFAVVPDSIKFIDGYLVLTMIFLPMENFVKNHRLSYSVVVEIVEGSETYKTQASIVRVKGNKNETTLLLRIWGK